MNIISIPVPCNTTTHKFLLEKHAAYLDVKPPGNDYEFSFAIDKLNYLNCVVLKRKDIFLGVRKNFGSELNMTVFTIKFEDVVEIE